MITKDLVEDIYRLSPMQEGMFFHTQDGSDKKNYFVQFVYSIKSQLDVNILQQSYQLLIDNHPILRTVFMNKYMEKPYQVVLKKRRGNVLFEDISDLPAVQKEELVQAAIQKDLDNYFDLTKDILFRISVIKLNNNDWRLIISNHHIIIDGWCTGMIVNELFHYYSLLKNNETIHLKKARPFSEYITWIHSQDQQESLKYWRSYLAEYNQKAVIPSQYPNVRNQDYKLDEVSVLFDEKVMRSLINISTKQQVTMSNLLTSIWGILLQRYNNTNDVVFGSVVQVRPTEIEDIENMVGIFINTIPTRIQSKENQSFIDLIKDTQQRAVESKEYNYTSLAEIQAQCELKSGLLDHFVIFQNYPTSENSGKEEIKITDFTVFEQTHYNFSLMIIPSNTLKFKFYFNNRVYSKEFIQYLSKHVESIVRQIVKNPEILIKEIEIVTESEKEVILDDFSINISNYLTDKTLIQLFEEQVKRTPNHKAVFYNGTALTYRELNERANQVAHVLVNKGVTRNEVVGISIERSTELIIGLLGILKAGGAFFPIDPSIPAERASFMIENSGANIVLTNDLSLVPKVFGGEILLIDNNDILTSSSFNLSLEGSNQDLLYLLYTSGTTGEPKGVQVENKTLVNLVAFHKENTNITFDSVLQFAAMSFDVSYQEIFSTLLYGGKLYILDDNNKRNINYLITFIKENNIETLFFPTSFLKHLISEVEYIELLTQNVNNIIVAGEQLILNKQFRRLLKKYNVKLYNQYGPTETHIVSSYAVDPEIENEIPPIGKPISSTDFLVLSEHQLLQPVGIEGELYIGGVNLARGYHNREELTRSKFIPHPFKDNELVYKTGDLVRWLPDGNLDYIGRRDDQVKIRGYRIELGEIENVINTHSKVKQSIVRTVKNDQDLSLCAYIVSNESITISELKEFLKLKLPEYMVPADFIQLDRLPMTLNGKVDRRALPKPERKYSGTDYVAPRTPTEKKLADIWSSVLGIEQIGAQDHFFDIGGHSLKAMMLVSRIHKEFQVEFPLKEIFAYPTLEELARYIEGGRERAYTAIEPAAEQPYYPLSSAQKRLYLVREIEGEGVSYNMPVALRVEGPLELKQLHQAFQALVNRHEVLRTSFALQDGELVQQIHSSVEVPYLVQKVSSETEVREHIQAFIRPFDLQQAPLFRAGVLQLATEEHIVLWDTHHIISDGLSSVVLQQELVRLYQGESLEAPVLQYKDYAVWEQEQLHSGAMEAAGEYWKAQFAGEVPILDFPTDYTRPAIQQFAGDYVSFELSEELSQRLIELSKMQGVTLYMTLLAAYQVLLSKYTGQEDIVVGTPVAGRPQAELEKTVGMFVHTLALRSMPAGEKSFSAYLSEVKEQVLQAFVHQAYPLEELVEHVSVQRDLSRNPLFDTVFVLQNFERQAMEVPGLKLTPYAHDFKIAKFDLTLQMIERGTHLGGQIEYSSHLFRAETMERLTHHWMQLLEAIVEQPGSLINELEIVTAAEKEQLLHAFNDTKTTYPAEKTIVQLFEEQVSRTPEQVAVVYEEESVTYDELNQRANQLARVLVGKGVGPEKIVGILVDRSVEMIVGILGILKAGGAYLPIDPAYPEDRIEFMLNDSGTKVLLTQGHLPGAQAFRGEVIDLMDRGLYEGEADALPVQYAPDHLAYIIYTSGTTGKPKGTMIEQHSLVNLSIWHQREFLITESDRSTKFAGFGFDASVWEVFPYLISGARLYIVDDLVRYDIKQLKKFFIDNKITISYLPTQYCELFMKEDCPSLRLLLTGGDKLKQFTNNNYRVVNNYGPTENTVVSTSYTINGDEEIIPIGQPIDNVTIYIINGNSQLQPIGVVGELCVSGEGLARGYLNQPKLTKEKFVPNPFMPNTLIYKTGDLARWLPDGNIEYIGRVDDQVKIRGFRIEIGEITELLINYPQIEDVIVMPRSSADEKYLCAYFISEESISRAELVSYLKQNVPDYMIPSYFVQLDKFPINANGKVDRKELPKPNKEARNVQYVAPRNKTEESLVRIWSNVLGVESIGVFDDFFQSGGDSLKAMTLVTQIYQDMNIDVPITNFFKSPTISSLSESILKDELEKTGNIVLLNQGNDTEPPVFLVHGSGGGILNFVDLANSLDKDKTIYAIKSYGYEDGNSPKQMSVDEIAELYIEQIKEITSGPYYFIGYSFGGVIAYEMTRKLEELGSQIVLLSIIDSPMTLNIQDNIHFSRKYIEEEIIKLESKSRDETLQSQNNGNQKQIYNKELINLYNKHAYLNYVPNNKVKVDIQLFIAMESIDDRAIIGKEDVNKWSQATQGKVNEFYCKANHFNIIQKPQLDLLINHINELLKVPQLKN
ncbi:amino acid adenylation domain-containing protein [Paenibacillus silvae]|uniref:non-ribosomal peptide synthetase n=1 Tax=Paenibacillus silvae TaxID=1325358 RepID=UPI0025A1A93E|nr:non-ribosomal peptide synthetase [Paenibacillus silvae]MDM5281497.1 amino acid adenylation domain-containing protein [Paenibacillus silvae]